MISSYLTLTHLQHVIYRSSVQGILTNAPNDVRAMFHSNVKQMWVRYPHSSLTLKISNSFRDEWHYLLLTLFTVEKALKKQNIAQERTQKGLLSCFIMRDFRGLIKVNQLHGSIPTGSQNHVADSFYIYEYCC